MGHCFPIAQRVAALGAAALLGACSNTGGADGEGDRNAVAGIDAEAPDPAEVAEPTAAPEPVGTAPAVQQHLRDALAAALVSYTDLGNFMRAQPNDLEAIEPKVAFGSIEAASDAVVGVGAEPNRIVLLLRAEDGEWFCIAHNVFGEGTTFGRDTDVATIDSPSACSRGAW